MKNSSGQKAIRKKAEELLSRKKGIPKKISSWDMEKLLHELDVHQVKLEMQNDELRKAQEDIEEARSRYVDLYEHAPVGYLTLKKTGIIREANLTAAALLGVDRSLLCINLFSIFVFPGDRVLFEDCQRRVYQIPGRQSCELRLVKRGGDPIWVSMESVAEEDADGKLTGMRLTISDITERKRAEAALGEANQKLRAGEALRESEERFRQLAEASFEGIGVSYQGVVIEANAQLAAMLGCDLNELIGRPVADFIASESLGMVMDHINNGSIGAYEHLARRKDGSIFPVEARGRTMTWKGRIVRVTALRDIPDRKQAEEASRRYELLSDHSRDIILFIQRDDRRILEANAAASDAYGYSREELLTLNISDLRAPETRSLTAEQMAEADLRGILFETVHQRKDGSTFPVEVSSRGVTSNGSRSLISVIRDITERKRMEEELCRSRDELEIRVQERTVELDRANEELQKEIARREKTEQQLLQAQKLESIGTLTGGIAHDFNNILGAVVINSEMALLDLPGGSGVRSNIDLVLKSGLRGRDLVKQMLLFSRKSEKRQEVLTLTPVIKDTFKLLRSSLPTTIQMKLLLETESDSVSADPSQIQQVIMNLCTNAAYAMRGTTGSIDIGLQSITFGSTDLPDADMQPGEYVVLSVKDTGSGMDEKVKNRIFEPFFTTKPVGEGTGLGLSVVYGIVKNHNGNITVYSEPGKGSIFKVYLPRVDTGTSVAPEAPKPIPRGNERILLVDDEDFNIKTVENMLQHLGYKVTALMDSQEALRLFSEKPSEFDLVMTDQTMPFMTGEDLGKEIIRIRPDIPVILCTGYSDLVSLEKATSLGFRGYIMKPFTVREGAELVRRVLDEKESRGREKSRSS